MRSYAHMTVRHCVSVRPSRTVPPMTTTTTPKRRTDLISAPEAARTLGVHPATIRRYFKLGILTRYTFPPGRITYVDPAELDALLIATPQTKP